MLGLAVSVTWFVVYKISKISSLSALVAAVLAPAYVWFIVKDGVLVAVFVLISVILLWRHKSNIQRLIAGEEK